MRAGFARAKPEISLEQDAADQHSFDSATASLADRLERLRNGWPSVRRRDGRT